MGRPLNIPLGNSTRCDGFAHITIHTRGWFRGLVLGESGAGKTAQTLDTTVRISKHRKVVIFDSKGEWRYKVTEFGWYKEKKKMDNVKVITDFKLSLKDIEGSSDFVSFFGSSDKVFQVMDILFHDGRHYHEYNIEKFKNLIDDFPTSITKTVGKGRDKVTYDLVKMYEDKYDIDLGTSIHFNVAQSLRTSFRYIEKFFAKPSENYVDFEQELKRNDHLIIEIGNDTATARFLCGIALRKLREAREMPFFVFEELSLLLPNVDEGFAPLPSSVIEIHSILTTGRKEGIGFLGIVQHESQIYNRSLEHIFTKIFVGRYSFASGWYAKKAEFLKWDPHARGGVGVREALIVNNDGTWDKYVPFDCCCRC